MKIVSWNTNGLRATIRQGNFAPLFKDADIICLQETKISEEKLNEEMKTVPGYFSYFCCSSTRKGYSGVAIYSKIKSKETFFGMGIKKFDEEGRLIGMKFKDFTLINVYFPNGGQGPERLKYKLEFYNAFLDFILKLRKKGEHIIFCGDINTAHKEIDLARPKENVKNTGFLPEERAWIDKVVKKDFVDIYRHFYKDEKGAYTYWDQKTFSRERNVGWRIDYFFASLELLPKIKGAGIMPQYFGSDHCPIWIEIKN